MMDRMVQNPYYAFIFLYYIIHGVVACIETSLLVSDGQFFPQQQNISLSK